MAYNVELRVNNSGFGTDIANKDRTVYIRSHWDILDGKPSTYAPAAHNQDASTINSGVFADARIPSLNASKITAGTFGADRIPSVLNDVYSRKYYVNANGVPSSNLGSPTVQEMALFQEQFNNKTEFHDITKITFESFDGTTWTDVSSTISDQNKRRFVGGDINATVNIPNLAVKYRITLRATSYVYLNALYIYWSSQSHSTKVTIWKKHDSASWEQVTSSTVSVSAWPGHLYLPFPTIAWNPTATLGSHWHEVRIEFEPTWSGHATYGTYPILLRKLQLWGGYPAGRRTIYTLDENKGASFPQNVYASNFYVGANVAVLNNDSRLSDSRPASDVYSWAKAASKPSYQWSEIGNRPSTIVDYNFLDFKVNLTNQDANNLTISGFYHCSTNVPTSDGESDKSIIHNQYGGGTTWATQIAVSWRNGRMWFRNKENGTWEAWHEIYSTNSKPSMSDLGGRTAAEITAEIGNAISDLLEAAPSTLDTLNELAAALGDDPNFATTVNTALGNRVIKNADITPGTKPKITYDAKGLVTGGADLIEADIPTLQISKISGLQAALDAKLSSIASDYITNTMLANMAVNTLKGRVTAGTGDPEDLSVSQVKTMLSLNNVDNVADASKYVLGLRETRENTQLKIWNGTQAQYDAIGSKDTTTIYFIEA